MVFEFGFIAPVEKCLLSQHNRFLYKKEQTTLMIPNGADIKTVSEKLRLSGYYRDL